MILTEELFSLRMGRETWTRPQEDMWTGPRIHVDKTPERHVTQISGDQGDKEMDTHSHSPGRQQPVNQEDRLWHKKRGGGVKKRTDCDHHGGRMSGQESLWNQKTPEAPAEDLRGLQQCLLRYQQDSGPQQW